MGIISLVTGEKGASGFGSATTAEQVTDGIDASNLTVVITGGASGIGLETARVLALRKAHVVIAARNMEAANNAKDLILEENKAARVDVLELDLSSLHSVTTFVNDFNDLELPLNVLINNAGVMFCPFQLSKDGIEMQFATNHLVILLNGLALPDVGRVSHYAPMRIIVSAKCHFLLTSLLLDKMKQTAKDTGTEGRIVNLSYSDKKAYGQSKLANILHANAPSRRLKEEGAAVTANSVHPGLINTPLWRHSALLSAVLKAITYPLWKNVPQGAATTCYVALHPAIKGVTGKYYYDCNEFPCSPLAKNEILAKELWDFSNKMIISVLNK